MVQRLDLRGPNGRAPNHDGGFVEVNVTDMLRIHVDNTVVTVAASDVVHSVREFNHLYQESERLRALSGGGD
jgi:hypothetical protein